MTDGEYRVDLIAYDSDGNVCGIDFVNFTYSTATSDSSSDAEKGKAPDCGCDFGNNDVAPIDLTLFVLMLMGPAIVVRIWKTKKVKSLVG